MTWYKDWFNSENYLKVYRHRDETEAQSMLSVIEKNIKLNPGSSVLDMACGAGRHSIVFAKKGFRVTAVDLSSRLISEAKQNAQAASVIINFVLSDILDYETNEQFDLVVNLFTSIGYFENEDENYSVISKACKFLSKGGYFVIDYFNKDFLLKNLIPTSIISENGIKITQNRSIKGNRVVKKINIENDGTIDKYYESVRLYSYEEIKNMLTRSGFKITNEIGDFHGSQFEKNSSPRLILFARK